MGIGQVIEIWPYKRIIYAQRGIRPRKCESLSSLDFWDTNGSLNHGQTTRPIDSNQKKSTCQIVDFAVLADRKLKLRKSEKKDKYIGVARELKKKKNYRTWKLWWYQL